MNELFLHIGKTLATTSLDILPIAALLFCFQFLVIRRKLVNLRHILIGFFYVLSGLTLFLVGLEEALFPIGKSMAIQLTVDNFIRDSDSGAIHWYSYFWIYLFTAAIGFAATIAEPALIAVSLKATEISGGSLSSLGLRIAVAIGVACGVTLGVHRIITGTALPIYIMIGYTIVIIQTSMSRSAIIPLAYDSGGVTTSTVTVPILAALGLGLTSTIPDRNPLIDGFGLIAFASLSPIMSVLTYELLTRWLRTRAVKKSRRRLNHENETYSSYGSGRKNE